MRGQIPSAVQLAALVAVIGAAGLATSAEAKDEAAAVERKIAAGNPEGAWAWCQRRMSKERIGPGALYEACAKANLEQLLKRIPSADDLDAMAREWRQSAAAGRAMEEAGKIRYQQANGNIQMLTEVARNYPDSTWAAKAWAIIWQPYAGVRSVPQLEQFLKTWPDSPNAPEAQRTVEELMFAEAERADTAAAWKALIERYPKHARMSEIKKRWYDALYRETERVGTVDAWQRMLAQAPDHPRSGEVVARVNAIGWSEASEADNAGAYALWLQKWPRHPQRAEVEARLARAQLREAWLADAAAKEAFLGKNPTHPQAALLREGIAQGRLKVEVGSDATGWTALAPGRSGYRVAAGTVLQARISGPVTGTPTIRWDATATGGEVVDLNQLIGDARYPLPPPSGTTAEVRWSQQGGGWVGAWPVGLCVPSGHVELTVEVAGGPVRYLFEPAMNCKSLAGLAVATGETFTAAKAQVTFGTGYAANQKLFKGLPSALPAADPSGVARACTKSGDGCLTFYQDQLVAVEIACQAQSCYDLTSMYNKERAAWIAQGAALEVYPGGASRGALILRDDQVGAAGAAGAAFGFRLFAADARLYLNMLLRTGAKNQQPPGFVEQAALPVPPKPTTAAEIDRLLKSGAWGKAETAGLQWALVQQLSAVAGAAMMGDLRRLDAGMSPETRWSASRAESALKLDENLAPTGLDRIREAAWADLMRGVVRKRGTQGPYQLAFERTGEHLAVIYLPNNGSVGFGWSDAEGWRLLGVVWSGATRALLPTDVRSRLEGVRLPLQTLAGDAGRPESLAALPAEAGGPLQGQFRLVEELAPLTGTWWLVDVASRPAGDASLFCRSLGTANIKSWNVRPATLPPPAGTVNTPFCAAEFPMQAPLVAWQAKVREERQRAREAILAPLGL